MSKPCWTICRENLNPRPALCLPDFLRENKIALPAAEEMRELSSCCRQWAEILSCLRLSLEGSLGNEEQGVLFIYLPENVELQVSEAWRRSPEQGYILHCLAQKLCRAALGEILPEVGASGCAPLPRLGREEEAALRLALVAHVDPNDGKGASLPAALPGMGRVYSLLTYYPYVGGCVRCALRENCPGIRHS